MKTMFEIGEPALVSRKGLLGACNAFAIALDNVMGSVQEIERIHCAKVYAHYNDSPFLQRTDGFGLPLTINCRLLDSHERTVTGRSAKLYVNQKTEEALALMGATIEVPSVEVRGDIEAVVSAVSIAMLEHFKASLGLIIASE